MKVYIKFISVTFLKSLFFVFLIVFSLVFLLNILSELEFFKDLNTSINFTIFLALINSPSLIFEMFPFILLISTQLFFIKFIQNKEIEIFKYSGLKNSKIIFIIGLIAFAVGLFVSIAFYNLSSNLKNLYLELKSNYASDGKYLAVITKNGLWIKDKINNKILITNSSKIKNNYLIENFITEFDSDFKVLRNIQTEKLDITNNLWIAKNAKVYFKNNYEEINNFKIKTNFNSKRIQSLYSNLSALSLMELIELRNNYKSLNYSIIDIDLHLIKISIYPIFLCLMTIFSSLIMIATKYTLNTSLKILFGLFFSVIIYYLNNFSYVLGSTQRLPLVFSLIMPMILLTIVNCLMIYKVNEK